MKRLVLCMFLAPSTLLAAPEGMSSTKITVELRQVKVARVFELLGDISGEKITVDACVADELVDLNLKNTPVNMVFDVVASRFALVAAREDGTVRVRCAGDQPVTLDRRMTVEARELPLDEVMRAMASAAGLKGIDCALETMPRVTLNLRNVRVRTMMAAVEDSAGVRLEVRDGVLVARAG